MGYYTVNTSDVTAEMSVNSLKLAFHWVQSRRSLDVRCQSEHCRCLYLNVCKYKFNCYAKAGRANPTQASSVSYHGDNFWHSPWTNTYQSPEPCLCLPMDLIILLISKYFKDKWVHLANPSTINMGACAWEKWADDQTSQSFFIYYLGSK